MATTLTKLDISRIEECHPILQKLWYACAKDPDCPPFIIVDGARTIAEQKRNVARGASKTMRSRHLPAKNGWSHATDIAPLVNGKLTWDWKYYHKLTPHIWRIAKELGIEGLEWGGNWKSFKDGPHWQLSWRMFSGNVEYADNVEPDDEIKRIERELNIAPKQRESVGNFRRSIPLVLKHEGGFVNDPKDVGGATNKGITLTTFRKYIKPKGSVNDLRKITDEQAIDVYKQYYWDACRCDMLPTGVDHAVFDFAVNSGNNRSKEFLQSIVGTTVDRRIGPATLKAVNAMAPAKLVEAICDERAEYIHKRVKSGKLHSKFEKGILVRIERVRKEALDMVEKPIVVESEKPKVSAPPAKGFFAVLFEILGKLLGKKG